MLEKIRQIKYSRLSEEERFFLETIDGIQPFTSDKYIQSVFWVKNDIVLLEQDYESGWLRVNYDIIWSIFSRKYRHNYTDTQSVIKDVINKHTKLGTLIPLSNPYSSDILVSKELTPRCTTPPNSTLLDKHTNFGSLTPDLMTLWEVKVKANIINTKQI